MAACDVMGAPAEQTWDGGVRWLLLWGCLFCCALLLPIPARPAHCPVHRPSATRSAPRAEQPAAGGGGIPPCPVCRADQPEHGEAGGCGLAGCWTDTAHKHGPAQMQGLAHSAWFCVTHERHSSELACACPCRRCCVPPPTQPPGRSSQTAFGMRWPHQPASGRRMRYARQLAGPDGMLAGGVMAA